MTETAAQLILTHVGVDFEIPSGASEGYWVRCHEPERPGDLLAVYYAPCDACYLGLTVDARVHSDPKWGEALDDMQRWRTDLGLST